jgi:RimJ/RimL family protein N-acetyltransferase
MVQLTTFGKADFDTLISWIGNEALLVQIAGRYFTFPLTAEQLEHYLLDDKSIAFNIVDTESNNVIGHAEIILAGGGLCKIDKLIIGNTAQRGKGYGGTVIHLLLQYCFAQLNAAEAELNVYDWNIAGMRCYEKAGFTYTGILQQTAINGEIWTAKNMRIDRNKWMAGNAAVP